MNPNKSDQSIKLRYFTMGSMLVLFVCLTIAAIFLSYSFLQKERQRAIISKAQIEHFFEFHHTAMSEEMWTGSLEPIARRVAIIANQVGGATWTLVISNESGKCLLSQKQTGVDEVCAIPNEMKAFIDKRVSHFTPEAIFNFDEKTEFYTYLVPLAVGDTVKGFLYVTLSDPYDFNHGTLSIVASSMFLPILFFILLVWLLWLFASRQFFLIPYLRYVDEMKSNERFADQARRTAHDLRDPLSGIERCLKRLNEFVPQSEQKQLQSFLYQVEDVAYGLLNQSAMALRNSALPTTSVELLLPIIDRVISRKKVQYSEKSVSISLISHPSDWKLFANIVEIDFERLLSNLINNSVEAIERDGLISIEVLNKSTDVEIKITDTGRGIPKEVLPKLGQKGFTFGKKFGNGLGLHYAKALIESWGGSIQIASEETKGTTLCLLLPKVESPAWFASEINIEKGSKVVILDDQPYTHDLWKERFKNIAGITLSHFSKVSELLKINTSEFSKPVLYLFDYDLKGERQTGLDVIDELDLFENSILVTSHYDEQLRQLCERIGVKLLPKKVAAFVPIIQKG